MEPRISIITLVVEYLVRSVRFYRDDLGLPMDHESGEVAFFQTSGAQLGLYPRKAFAQDAAVPSESQRFRGFTISHNLRSREECERRHDRGRGGGREDRQACPGCLLRRLLRVFSRSRRLPLGDRLDPPLRDRLGLCRYVLNRERIACSQSCPGAGVRMNTSHVPDSRDSGR